MRHLLVTLIISCAASAAPVEDVAMMVTVGVGDNVARDAVVPIRVELHNTAEQSYNGNLQAFYVTYGGSNRRVYRSLSLPAGARKSVFLYLEPPKTIYSKEIEVIFANDSGHTVVSRKQEIDVIDAKTPRMCFVGQAPPNLPKEKREDDKLRYKALSWRLHELPDRVDGYTMFDTVVISPPPAKSLPEPQARALCEWTRQGGLLVVDMSRRSDAYESGTLAPVLRGALTKPMSGTGSRTLPFGAGRIEAFYFDPQDEALRDDPKLPNRWAAMTGLNLYEDLRHADVQQEYYNNYSSFNPPSFLEQKDVWITCGVILGLLVLYMLLASVGDYLLVKRLKRFSLTWVTFPTLVVTFTCVVYVAAQQWFGTQLKLDLTRVTVVLPDSDHALQIDRTTLQFPLYRPYHIKTDTGAVLWQEEADSQNDREYVWMDQENGEVLHRPPVWSERTYISSMETKHAPDIECTTTWRGDALVVSVTNGSPYDLNNVDFFYEGLYWKKNISIPSATSHTESLLLGKNAERFRQGLVNAFRTVRDDVMLKPAVRASYLQDAVVMTADCSELAEGCLLVDGTRNKARGPQRVAVVAEHRAAKDVI